MEAYSGDRVTARVGRRGVVTLPKRLRDRYRIREGDVLTLVDLGGVFLLLPPSRLDYLADEIERELQARGLSLESMLRELRAIREKSRL